MSNSFKSNGKTKRVVGKEAPPQFYPGPFWKELALLKPFQPNQLWNLAFFTFLFFKLINMASTMFEDYSSTPSLITEIDELEAYIQSLSDDDYVDFIADFLKPTPLEMGFVVIFFILMVVGIIGNSLVVYVVVSNRHMVSKFFGKCLVPTLCVLFWFIIFLFGN